MPLKSCTGAPSSSTGRRRGRRRGSRAPAPTRRRARRAPAAARRCSSAPIGRPPVRSSLSRWREVLGADHRAATAGAAARPARTAPRRPRPTRAPPPDATDPPDTGTDSGPMDVTVASGATAYQYSPSRFAGGVGVRAVGHGEHVAAPVVDHRERAGRRGGPVHGVPDRAGHRVPRQRRLAPAGDRDQTPVGAGRSASTASPGARSCAPPLPIIATQLSRAAAPMSPTVIGRCPAAAAAGRPGR